MRIDRNFDEQVAGDAAAVAAPALAFQAQALAILGQGRDNQIDRSVIGNSDTFLAAKRGFDEVYTQGLIDISAATGWAGLVRPVAHIGSGIVELFCLRAGRVAVAPITAKETFQRFLEILSARTLRCGCLAVMLTALIFVGQHIIGCRNVSETSRVRGIIGIKVGVEGLREPSIRLLDLLGRGVLGNLKNGIGIEHARTMRPVSRKSG